MATMIMVVTSIYLGTALFEVRGAVDQERLYKTKRQMYYLQNAVADYRINNNSTPLSDLSALLSKPSSLSSCYLSYSSNFTTMQLPRGWCGPYIDTSLFLGTSTAYQEDAWGTVYLLSSSGTAGDYTYTILSCGENLTCGDSDDISVSF